ncbi:SAICAR synthase-like protein [Flagelloscypha sp. PMI_526]|nr:SAICAR synthase-like protein [Flagelloscypha sp. PMI_526]
MTTLITATQPQRMSVASTSSVVSSSGASFLTAQSDSASTSRNSLPSTGIETSGPTNAQAPPPSSVLPASSSPSLSNGHALKDAVDVQIVKVSADLSHPVFSRALSESPPPVKTLPFPDTPAEKDDDRRPSSLDTARTGRASTSTLRPTAPVSQPPPAAPALPVKVPPENLLHPPSTTATNTRPTRRNTTGSVPPVPSVPVTSADADLMNDISAQAEMIRKERQERRQQQQQVSQSQREAKRVVVGNLIGEDHVNYILMYNMLTGIRTCVSRCQAKIRRPIVQDDFSASHKYTFDIIGNELTPSAKYDFKFKDYAPWVFRDLRESYFHLDPADYLVSLTGQYILSELGSPGKSGSFFYFSKDYRFIIKTIHPAEHAFLLKVLPKYYEHVKSNPHTLISRFYGLHRVKLPHGRKIHFVIMNNLFPPHKDIHETYDLKGSTVGRLYPWDKAKEKGSGAVLKDLNWIEKGLRIELGPEKRALLTEQLRRDKEFLKEIKVMDYSLLIGIHFMQRGNRDKLRKNTLKVFSPEIPRPLRRSATSAHPPASSHAFYPPSTSAADPETVRKAVKQTPTLQPLGRRTIRLPKELITDAPLTSEPLSTADLSPPPVIQDQSGGGEASNRASTIALDSPGPDSRAHFLFYQDEGGLCATDEANKEENVIYYLGVIDILTPWNLKKRAEGLYKGIKDDRRKISPIPPAEYADRFFDFMRAVMRGGKGGESFR